MYSNYANENKRVVRKSNKGKISPSVLFLLIGIAMLVGAVMYKIYTDKFMAEAKPVEAEVTKIVHKEASSRKHAGNTTVYVSFTVDGVRYDDVILDYRTPSIKEGVKVKVYYREENPREILTNLGSKGTVYALLGFGVFLTVLSGYFVVQDIKNKIKKSTETL